MDAFQTLAELMMSQCPAGYGGARLEAELDANYASVALVCQDEEGGELSIELPPRTSVDLHYALENVRQEMAQQTGNTWKTCVATIRSDGKFAMDVGY